jgi:triacylglycerol esterase/lipase EstA (alpha/beta hydrolase family)
MRPEEIRALGDLAGRAIGGGAARVRDMHEGIAERTFAAVGPGGAPVQAIHDRIAGGVYKTVGGTVGVAARLGARVIAARRPSDTRSIHDSAAGRVALGALNGAFGDLLERDANPLALAMTIRRGGRDVGTGAAELARAFPDATPRLAIFLHGLCETDDAWRLRASEHAPYGERLQRELGYTPVYVRYNSGRHISENGRDLARLLADTFAAWPTQVTEIALIGHSMGGLVARSSCHYGVESDWVARVRHVFMLGCPHTGAPLERITNAASAALAKLPETRTFAKALNLRSAGVKDLRYGYLLDDDWTDRDPDVYLRHTACEIPFLGSANHYFVSATLSAESDSPVGRAVGDLLVMRSSAWGHGRRGERLPFPVDHYRHYGGANHFDLLNHPAVYEQIRRWLESVKALPPPAGV